MSRLFKSDVIRVYHTVRLTDPSTDSSVWNAMKKVVYNDSHVISIRYHPKYNRKGETLVQYGQRLKAAALSLGYEIPEKQSCDQFITELPASLRDRARLLSGPCDGIAEKTAKAERAALDKGERFFALAESKRSYGMPHPGYVFTDGRKIVKKKGRLATKKRL